MEQQALPTVFEMEDLDIIVSSHISRFSELLIARYHELEKRNVIKKKIAVSLMTTADDF